MRTHPAFVGFLFVLCAAATTYFIQANDMHKIQFDLGRNIVETARQSGAPKFINRNVAGLISYELVDLPPDIAVHYVRPDHLVKALPVFALTLYADSEHANDLAVEAAALQLSTDAISSHESAQNFVDALVSQFRNGKWKRYIDELCPAVIGRSSFLNEKGEPEQIGNCALDPDYRLILLTGAK